MATIIVATGCIATEHELLNRIRQVAPHVLLSNAWFNTSLPSPPTIKKHRNPFICFCKATISAWFYISFGCVYCLGCDFIFCISYHFIILLY